MKWRVDKMCADCPFAKSGAGLRLRKSLAPGRWKEILESLRKDNHFLCHKTTDETGNGTNLTCAGSLEWQARHGHSSNMERVMSRLDAIRQRVQP